MATNATSWLKTGSGVVSKVVDLAVALTIQIIVMKHPSDAADLVMTVAGWIDQIVMFLRGSWRTVRPDVRPDNLEAFVDLVQQFQCFSEVVPTDQRFTAKRSTRSGFPPPSLSPKQADLTRQTWFAGLASFITAAR